MTTCREMASLLYDYVEGQLDRSTQEELTRHFADCPPCVAFLNTYRQTIRLSQSLSCVEIPSEVQTRLRAVLCRQLQQPSSA